MSSEAAVRTETAPPRPFMAAGDLWGGLAAMLVAFPSAIAFGVVIFTAASPSLAGAGALAGIVGAAALGIVAPLVSRNRGFITAPCAPAAAVMSGLAAELVGTQHLALARVLALLALTALVSSAFQVSFGALRFGRVIKFVPYQVVTGYLSGVAVIIFAAQIPRLLGRSGGTGLAEALVAPHLWRWQGIVVGGITIAAMSLAVLATRKVPGAVIGLGAGVAAYWALAAFRPELRSLAGNPLIVGPVGAAPPLLATAASRLASLASIGVSDVMLVIGPALTLAVLLSVDTLKTGVVVDALTRSRHDSNRELIGQGVANAVSFFAGGVPGSAAMGPTLVNVSSGGKTLWSGVVEGALILGGFLAFGTLLAWVPIAALAGILLVVAWRMFDFKIFRLLILPGARLDFAVIAAVIIVAESIGLIQASLVGVLLAILLFIRNQIHSSVILRRADLTRLRSKRRRTADEVTLLEAHGEQALLVQLKDDLFFGTTDQLFTELEHDLGVRRYILLDLRRIESMDYTAAHLLLQMEERLHERDGHLLFSGMPSNLPSQQDITAYLQRLGAVSADHISVFETQDGALEWMEERILGNAGWVPVSSRPPLRLEELAIFRGLEDESLRALAACVRERLVPAGEKIFDVGDPGDEIFFVKRGRVHILLPLEGSLVHHLATMCRDDFFGEMSFLDRAHRSARAVAASDTELFSLSRSDFDRMAADHPAFAQRVFDRFALTMAHRLRAADAELRALEER